MELSWGDSVMTKVTYFNAIGHVIGKYQAIMDFSNADDINRCLFSIRNEGSLPNLPPSPYQEYFVTILVEFMPAKGSHDPIIIFPEELNYAHRPAGH